MKRENAQNTLARQLKFALGATLMSAMVAVVAHAGTVSVSHAGEQLEIASDPQKTVVTDLPLLDILAALDIPVVAVPSGRFEGTLAQYGADSVPKAGSMFEPDLDAIVALEPDLVIAGRRSTKAYQALADVAPAINLAFDQQNLLESVKATTRTLATIYGKQDVAEPLLAQLDASVKKLQKKTAQAGKGLLVITSGGKAGVQGPDSRFGVLFNDYGVQPAITDFPEGKGVPLTAELLQSVNPDWIYVLDRDAGLGRSETPAEQLLADAGVGQTTAGRQGQIVYLNPYNWYLLDGAGLQAMQQNVDQLLDALE